VSCLAWLGEHAACPPPRPTPKPIVDEATGAEVRSIHWFPYDPVRVVNVDP